MTAETSNARGELRMADIREDAREPLQLLREKLVHDEDGWAALCQLMPMIAAAPPPAAAEPKTLPVPTRVHLIGETAVIVGTPGRGWDEEGPDAHNCDAMGCATIGPHVLARVPFTDERAMPQAAEAQAQGGGEVRAWETEDGRVISARQKETALRDGGASASSVAIYSIPLYTAPPSASVGVKDVVMAARNAENAIRNCAAAGQIGDGYVQYADDLRDAVQRLAQQPAAARVDVRGLVALAEQWERDAAECRRDGYIDAAVVKEDCAQRIRQTLGISAIAEALAAEGVQAGEVYLREQPCGCRMCVCEDEKQCQGCGAKHCGNRTDHPPYVKQQPEARGVVDEAMVERATTAYLQSRGTYEGEVPVDRDDIRAALTAALAQQPAAVDGAYPTPRNRAEAVALARLALAYLGVIDAHIDAAVARCETDLATQHQEPTT